ncbi:Uncharacterised protein [uncultured archaeon]|nr:Uncharacterised protein [uncultured archaeon]
MSRVLGVVLTASPGPAFVRGRGVALLLVGSRKFPVMERLLSEVMPVVFSATIIDCTSMNVAARIMETAFACDLKDTKDFLLSLKVGKLRVERDDFLFLPRKLLTIPDR